MSWVKEDRPWKFHIELQTACPGVEPKESHAIDDAAGIMGSKAFRYLWGGGNTQAEAIDNMEKEFINLCKRLRKDMAGQGKYICF